MSLWRLEWLRLLRTRRLFALVAVYGFFGCTAPLLARYTKEILDRVGGGVQVAVPEPTPVDGLRNYVSNANQLGLLVFVLVVSSAVAFDARREMAVFLRTRVGAYRVLLAPRYALSVAAGSGAFAIGALATWYGTAVLIGPIEAPGFAVAVLLSAVYLAFIAAVAAAFGAQLTSAVTTTVATLAVALALAVVGTIEDVGRWLPSHLLGSMTSLPVGAESVGSYVPATVVTIVATAALLVLASLRGDAREV
jgi:ABC-2 type transport system permease protein